LPRRFRVRVNASLTTADRPAGRPSTRPRGGVRRPTEALRVRAASNAVSRSRRRRSDTPLGGRGRDAAGPTGGQRARRCELVYFGEAVGERETDRAGTERRRAKQQQQQQQQQRRWSRSVGGRNDRYKSLYKSAPNEADARAVASFLPQLAAVCFFSLSRSSRIASHKPDD